MKKTNMAKKSLSAILVLVMLCSMLAMFPISVSAAASANTTLGTKSNPIIVDNADDLKKLPTTIQDIYNSLTTENAKEYRDFYVELTNHIDFEGGSWSGLNLENYTVFFEGGNHVISNFTAPYGLFSAFGENSTLQNLHIEGATISCSAGAAGAFIGTATDGLSLIHCSTDETTTVTNGDTGSTSPTGGLIGQTKEGTTNANIYLIDCTNNATVTAGGSSANVGGIIGHVKNSYSNLYIETCANNGAISNGKNTGGIVGHAEGIVTLKLTESTNTATVTTTSGYAGGLIGYAKGQSTATETWTVNYCRNTGAVTAPSYAGGIIGYSEGSAAYRVSYCGNEAAVSASNMESGAVGGILGYHKGSNYARTVSVSNCYNTGKLTLNTASSLSSFYKQYTGGIIGGFEATGCTAFTVSKSYELGARNVGSASQNKHGIIVGYIKGGSSLSVTDCKGIARTNATAIVGSGNATTTNSETIASEADISSVLDTLKRDVMLRRPNGDGSKDNPYQIGTAMELQWLDTMASFDNVTYIELTDNIDYDGQLLQIEFQDTREDVARVVHMNGNGHTISNYTSKTGIFERIGGGSTITNLHVADATITKANEAGDRHIGAIVGYVAGDFTMVNCSAAGDVIVDFNGTTGHAAGGLVGSVESNTAYALFVDCVSEATVTGAAMTGGILGKLYSPSTELVFMNCTNEGNVSTESTSAGAGGIIGELQKGASADFYNCKNSGTAAADIYGKADSDITVTTHEAGSAELLSKSATQSLAVRMKLTDHFGLMAITEITENGAPANLADYEYGFYFLESDDRVTPANLMAIGRKIEGTSYNGSTSVFYAAYTDMQAANLDRCLHFMAYAVDGNGKETVGAIRTVDVAETIDDLTDGYFGAQQVTDNKYEIELYRAMLKYNDAYDRYENTDLNIGVLNLEQNEHSKTVLTGDHHFVDTTAANVVKNLDAFAETMYDLGLDVMGMNECDVYRGTASYYGGYHTPWEVAQRMEALTGEEYYWAFATALNEASGVRPFYNYYEANRLTGTNRPDGLYYSGDGLLPSDGYADHSGYGEGLVSKYPIVAVEERHIDVAKYLTAPTDPGESATTAEKDAYAKELAIYNFYKDYDADYQYNSSVSAYERRVILIATLDVEGQLVTVMVTHWDHTSYTMIQYTDSTGATQTVSETANKEFTRVAATKECMQAFEDYSDRPVFLMGDLNVSRNSSYLADLDKVVNRAGNDNMTGTFENGSKIDHILYNDFSRIISYAVASKNEASDHLPAYVHARISPFVRTVTAPDLLTSSLDLSLQPTATYAAGDGAKVSIYEGVTEGFLTEYSSRLEAAGFERYTATSFNGEPNSSYFTGDSSTKTNHFATYVTDTNSVDLGWHAYGYLDSWKLYENNSANPKFGNKFEGGVLFVTVSPREGLTLPLVEAPEYETKCETLLTQIGMDDFYPDQSSNSYLVRLADGTFIVHDLGCDAQKVDGKTTADALYAILQKQALDPNNIVISAWITSHPHNDHMSGLLKFADLYATNPAVTVKQFVHNFADSSHAVANSQEATNPGRVSTAIKKFGSKVQIVKPHTGNVLYYANVKFNVLYTQENYMQLCEGSKYFDGNPTTMVLQMETDKGVKVLFGGDHSSGDYYNSSTTVYKPFSFNALAKRYGSFLESDIMTYFHHGLGGGTQYETNDAIKPKIILWPVSDSKCNTTSWHSAYVVKKNSSSDSGITFAEGYLHTTPNYKGVYGWFISDDGVQIVHLDQKNAQGITPVTTYDTQAVYLAS